MVHNGVALHFKGFSILNVVLDSLMAKGLNKADEVIAAQLEVWLPIFMLTMLLVSSLSLLSTMPYWMLGKICP